VGAAAAGGVVAGLQNRGNATPAAPIAPRPTAIVITPGTNTVGAP
jgi:hypothetical protein